MKKPTIIDVAQKANVHKSTVSRVINNSALVKIETREQVLKAIRELNYSPNSAAKSLASGKSKIIGFVYSVQEMDEVVLNPFFSTVLKGMTLEAKEHNYNILLITSAGSDYESYANVIQKHSLDGLIVNSAPTDKRFVELLEQLALPYVFISRYAPRASKCFVDFDSVTGAYLATKYLLDLKHTEIRFLYGEVRGNILLHNQERIAGFKKALEEAGIPFRENMVVKAPIDLEQSYYFIRNYMKCDKPTALLISNELTAMSSVHALADSGLSIPDDISVIAFGDVDFYQQLRPRLTTVQIDVKWLGATATRMLMGRINGGLEHPDAIIHKPELVIRESTNYPLSV